MQPQSCFPISCFLKGRVWESGEGELWLRVSGDVQLWPKRCRIRLFKRLTRDLQEKTYIEESKCVRVLHNLGCLSTISFTTLTPGFCMNGGRGGTLSSDSEKTLQLPPVFVNIHLPASSWSGAFWHTAGFFLRSWTSVWTVMCDALSRTRPRLWTCTEGDDWF